MNVPNPNDRWWEYMTLQQLQQLPLRLRLVQGCAAAGPAAALAVSELISNIDVEVQWRRTCLNYCRAFYRRYRHREIMASDILPMKYVLRAWRAAIQPGK